MFSAVIVAASAVGYLFFANDGIGRIAGWVGEQVKPSVHRRFPYLLKLEPIRIGSSDWKEAVKRRA